MRHVWPKKQQLSSLKGLDRWALIIGTIQPLMTIPQIWSVYSARDASQISIITWMSYNIASVVLLWYGLRHKLLPIIVAQIIWIIVQTALVIAVVIF